MLAPGPTHSTIQNEERSTSYAVTQGAVIWTSRRDQDPVILYWLSTTNLKQKWIWNQGGQPQLHQSRDDLAHSMKAAVPFLLSENQSPPTLVWPSYQQWLFFGSDRVVHRASLSCVFLPSGRGVNSLSSISINGISTLDPAERMVWLALLIFSWYAYLARLGLKEVDTGRFFLARLFVSVLSRHAYHPINSYALTTSSLHWTELVFRCGKRGISFR